MGKPSGPCLSGPYLCRNNFRADRRSIVEVVERVAFQHDAGNRPAVLITEIPGVVQHHYLSDAERKHESLRPADQSAVAALRSAAWLLIIRLRLSRAAARSSSVANRCSRAAFSS
jgi:hypothetical protein